MNQQTLKNYANLLVRTGGNVQKGQPVVITSDIEAAHFARLVQDTAYDAGASEVTILWGDEASTRTKYLRAADETFDDYPDWIVERYKYWDNKGVVYLHITSGNPDLLNGVDPERIKRFGKVAREKMREHSALTMSHKIRWSACAIPSPAWAEKVFPNISEDEAMEELWELIIKAARADGDDPIADWRKHRKSFVNNVNYLNEQQFTALRLTTGLGTNITIGLNENHVWKGGGSICANEGLPFFPNIPTEEIFTAPNRNIADGRVVASIPLSYQGNLIEGIDLTFKGGVVTEYKASKNQESLTNILEMDE